MTLDDLRILLQNSVSHKLSKSTIIENSAVMQSYFCQKNLDPFSKFRFIALAYDSDGATNKYDSTTAGSTSKTCTDEGTL